MKKSKIILTILGVVFLVGGVAVGLYLVGQRQILQKKAAPASKIAIVPSTQTKNPGDNFTFSVNLDTAENVVTVIDLKIIYDPNVITITSLQKGAGATSLDLQLSNTFSNGTIAYGIYTTDPANGLNGSNIEVLKVNATVNSGAAAGDSSITFDPATEAAASGEGQNVLVAMDPGTLTVSSGAGPTPSGSPTSSPTASPTGSANPTATPTPGGTATARPTSGATSTPVPTLRTSATPRAIPVTGVEWPTIAGAAIGVFVIIGSLLLAI